MSETTLKEARLLVDFLKNQGREELKIVIPSETFSDDDLQNLPDDITVLGEDCDSVEVVSSAAQVFFLNYFGTPIRAFMFDSDSVWFDPFDFHKFKRLKKNLLKDVEAAKQKLIAMEATDGVKYVEVFDDGKFIFSFEGLQALTEAGEITDNWFCSWVQSLLDFIEREELWSNEATKFSIGC